MDKRTIMLVTIIALVLLLVVALVGILYLIRKNKKLVTVIREHQKKSQEKYQLKMAEDIENSDVLRRMIPEKLFELLQVKDISELSFEKQRQAETVNLYINNNEFSKIIHTKDAKDVFSFINQFFEQAIPLIYENGGVVEGFQETGMSVLFFDEYEKAVVVAVSIMELLNGLALEKREPHYRNFTIGLCYDNSIIGVVGHLQRMSLLTLSAYAAGLSRWLQAIAEKYYAKILVTASFIENIPNYQKKFNVRFLGYIYIKNTDSIQKLYDVFDGDEQETRNRKHQTRMVFEKGVLLFSEQNYQEARQHFIEVLKTDRFDKAAKEYIYLCEQYQKEAVDNRKVYLEYYG